MDYKKILNYLLEDNIITITQYDEIESEFHKSDENDIIDFCESKGILPEEEIINIISKKINVPYFNLKISLIDKDLINIFPEDVIRNKFVIPIFKIQKTLTVGMYNPTDLYLIDELKKISGFNITPVLVSKSSIKNVITNFFGVQDSLTKIFEKLKIEIDIETQNTLVNNQNESHQPKSAIAELVDLIIEQAVIERASDIHIEPEARELRIRFRIDGILYEKTTVSIKYADSIISRIKVLANIDISEKRVPQDGRIKLNINGAEIDIRVATSPTVKGEKMVMRLFDKTQMLTKIDNIGLAFALKKDLLNTLNKRAGIFLVTGPTGSGKTTSLYSFLSECDSIKKNIVTIENPVEYELKKICQIEVNQKVGLTFATGLRSILRQDPDIIMVGEIRDYETAEISIRAALTGHFVLSTLHTNNAPVSITRLLDMGIEPYLIESTVQAILAQRLLRKLCPDCRETFIPSSKLLEKLEVNETAKEMKFYTSRGCKNCNYTGYRGRTGIFELLIINEEIKKLILRNASTEEIKNAAIKNGMTTLKESALEKVHNGITSLDEVLNVISGIY